MNDVSTILKRLDIAGAGEMTPVLLNKGGNLVVHLAPHPWVARLTPASSASELEAARCRARLELAVAAHLQASGVQALGLAEGIEAGPYELDGNVITLWRYVPETKLERPSPQEAYARLLDLAEALRRCPASLPALGVWERAAQSAASLAKQSDPRIQALLKQFRAIDEEMRAEDRQLQPCHGDAHTRNLLASPEGWLWIDFEDASLMPPYWDIASYVTNLAMFLGLEEPYFSYMRHCAASKGDDEAFSFAVTARALLSTLGNLDYALQGRGDLPFAMEQLNRAADFIAIVGSQA
ncbi:aminoglycoside phosphotransferase family protein [Paenibacillus sp. GCM10027626]|uniref:aminoglycoside phosphotransferase family protein n=1 Tax=Paenibacillus sp. GCM10027626 TaxID=3273411 RepID=UPI00362BB91B